MSKAYTRICTFAVALAFVISAASMHAQTISVLFNCPSNNPPGGTSYGFVSWNAPETEPSQVQLIEYYYGRGGSGDQLLGTGYSGESTEIGLTNGNGYEFYLYAGVTGAYGAGGHVIAQTSKNCTGNNIAASTMPTWQGTEVEEELSRLYDFRSIGEKANTGRQLH